MTSFSTSASAREHADDRESSDQLRQLIAHAAHYLPAQGPIEEFVHHNTLHALEGLSFHAAVRRGWEIYGAEPYLAESRFRQQLRVGRITTDDLDAVLANEEVPQTASIFDRHPELGTRAELRRVMVLHPHFSGPVDELRWVIAETDALLQFRADVEPRIRNRMLAAVVSDVEPGERHQGAVLEELWKVCCHGVATSSCVSVRPTQSRRVRDALLAATGVDADALVHDVLVRFTAAFLDQGYADWQLPDRHLGFWHSFAKLYGGSNKLGEPWIDSLAALLQRVEQQPITPLDCIEQSMATMGISEEDRQAFITQSLLALPGWAGMVNQMEHAPGWVDHPAPRGSLLEFLAVRLMLDQAAAVFIAADQMGYAGSPDRLMSQLEGKTAERDDALFQSAFELFQWSQLMGWTPDLLGQLSHTVAEGESRSEFDHLMEEISAFDSLERRRIFQNAFERHYQSMILAAVATTSQQPGLFPHGSDQSTDLPDGSPPFDWRRGGEDANRPSFQICTCIDDREESFRRHLEEIDPRCQTFGAAGFFAVAMNYQGVTDATYKPLCPTVITPVHYVRENVGYTFAGEHKRRTEARRALGRLNHQVHAGSRSVVGGVLASILGSLAAFPLVARVLFPRLTAQIRRRVGQLVQPPPITQLQLERYRPEPGGHAGNIGYSLDEMASIVRRLLEEIGLMHDFARLVVMTGHGSSSVNNPHASAYNCGACAGKRGGPNARAFAHMANDYRVRGKLADVGMKIPADTWFLGTYHNTCDDRLGWFDLDRMPPSHVGDFERTKQILDEATLRNAHERSRRFRSVSVHASPLEALRHVQQRSEDLSQVRPEYNHATNALCFVGRRDWSRNLFLDRRAFLTSYDPSHDDAEGTILARILAAAVPVCAGINLEYYFSTVDNVKYGSGSKLPHNLVSLLGVMEGAASDLRTGLYQQMIEIHEPMRLTFVIETTPEIMRGIMHANQAVGQLCYGEWIRIWVLHQASAELYELVGGAFRHVPRDELADLNELPQVDDSRAWYGGRRDHLGPARVRASQFVAASEA